MLPSNHSPRWLQKTEMRWPTTGAGPGGGPGESPGDGVPSLGDDIAGKELPGVFFDAEDAAPCCLERAAPSTNTQVFAPG